MCCAGLHSNSSISRVHRHLLADKHLLQSLVAFAELSATWLLSVFRESAYETDTPDVDLLRQIRSSGHLRFQSVCVAYFQLTIFYLLPFGDDFRHPFDKQTIPELRQFDFKAKDGLHGFGSRTRCSNVDYRAQHCQ